MSLVEKQEQLSNSEAEVIVADRMEARKAVETAKREAIMERASVEEWEAAKGDGTKTIYRRVAPPPELPIPESVEPVRREWTPEEIAEFLRREAEAKPRLNISLSATVFDHKLTEINLWYERERYKILSNVPFSYLQVIGSFEDETAEWSFYGMVDRVDAEKEARFAEQIHAFGGEYTPRPRPDKSLFTSMAVPEYLVLAQRDQVIPEEVFTQLDAIHSYYLANEKSLAVKFQRREALAEAHRKWRTENPEEPTDTIINFWPIRSNSERVSPVRTTATTSTLSEEVSR